MNIRKFLSNVGIVVGLFSVYLGVLVFLEVDSLNNADKSETYISKVKAELKFYYEDKGQHDFGNPNRTVNGRQIKLHNNSWSSKNYPLADDYSKIYVEHSNQTSSLGKAMVLPPIIRNIVVNTSRDSH